MIYTCKENFGLLPKAWKRYEQEDMSKRAGNISVLLENMINNILYQECFDEISRVAAKELQAEEILNYFPKEELLHMASFAYTDDVLIRWIIERGLAEDKNAMISGLTIPELCERWVRSHFGAGKKAEYEALLSGYRLLFATNFQMMKRSLARVLKT